MEVEGSSSHPGGEEKEEEQHPLVSRERGKQLMRLLKQTEKNMEKKTDKFTAVLKTHGFLA